MLQDLQNLFASAYFCIIEIDMFIPLTTLFPYQKSDVIMLCRALPVRLSKTLYHMGIGHAEKMWGRL